MEFASPYPYRWREQAVSGFSLLELMAMMAVAAILSVLVAPSIFTVLNSHGLSSGARDVSNHLVRARSEAIAKHTMTRFMVATTWPEEGEAYTRYSIWRWNTELAKFDQVTKWGALPKGIVFEPKLPDYIRKSQYAINDATSILGEDALSQEDAFEEMIAFGEKPVDAQFVEFLPNGSARIPGGVLNRVIFVLVEGQVEGFGESGQIKRFSVDEDNPENWAQINLDTLTGRVRINRP